jgi:hypothetical protein
MRGINGNDVFRFFFRIAVQITLQDKKTHQIKIHIVNLLSTNMPQSN